MSEETFEDEAPVDDETVADEDLGDEAIDDDLEDDDELADGDDALEIGLEDDIDVDAVVEDDTVARVVEAPAAKPKGDEEEEEEEVVDLDEELHPDDVEVPLDALLKERTAAATLEDEEEEIEEEEPESDASPDGPTRIVPRRAGEFLCSSCFLVLPRNQLQDEERMLCRDCA